MKIKKSLVVLTGAGISAESNISTFRDSNGMWENHNIEDVASLEGWIQNPDLVNNFYNLRRQNVREATPNIAHDILAELESKYDVTILTQNVDDLHERAGSTNVLHMHGEILTAISSDANRQLNGDNTIYPVTGDLNYLTDLDANGYSLRPNIVWFGEQVRHLFFAQEAVKKSDIFLVIGTSLNVFPVASLVKYAQGDCYNINPDINTHIDGYINIHQVASLGMLEFEEIYH